MKWTKEEIWLLQDERYSIEALVEMLPGRSKKSIQNKRAKIKPTQKRWTTDERNILAEHYGILDQEELLELLPGRSWDSIRSQAHYLRKRQWNISKYNDG